MNEEFEYDEELAVKFIQNYLPADLKEKISEDDIYYLLDVIYDFYDQKDWLSEDDDEQEEKELIQFLIQQTAKDGIGKFSEEEIRLFLIAEAAYADTLDISE